jgi:hypothetical protein
MYLEAQAFKNQQFWFDSWQPVVVTVASAWSAAYDVTGIPRSWSPGQTQSFTVFVRNNGSQVWPASGSNYVALDMHVSTQPGGSGVIGQWLTSQVFRLSADIAPGQTAQIAVHVTAPAQAGSLYVEAEMFKNQQLWFRSYEPVVIAVGGQQWSAGYDLSGVPATWSAGQTQWFTVFVKNTGSYTWPSGGLGYVALDLRFTSQAGGSSAANAWLTSQVFRLPADIAPGGTAQIPVRVTAPEQPGALYLEAAMFKNQQLWFPLAQPVQVNVEPALWWSGTDISGIPLVYGAPLAWRSGQTQSFTVVLTNTGNETWLAGGSNGVELDLHFTAGPGGSNKIQSWLTSQIFSLPADLAPGQSADLVVRVTAPQQTGSLYLEAQMFKNQQFWIQPWQPVAVTIS